MMMVTVLQTIMIVSPADSAEWLDSDNDSIGNNADEDDDGDGVDDDDDAFPLLASEQIDTDGDGFRQQYR